MGCNAASSGFAVYTTSGHLTAHQMGGKDRYRESDETGWYHECASNP